MKKRKEINITLSAHAESVICKKHYDVRYTDFTLNNFIPIISLLKEDIRGENGHALLGSYSANYLRADGTWTALKAY